MKPKQRSFFWFLMIGALVATAAAADKKQEFHYTLSPGATISISNEFGPVVLRPSSGNAVNVTAILHSAKVEIDPSYNDKRLDFRTHFLQNTSADEGRVDYQVTVPPGSNVIVRSATGPITAEEVHADLTLEGDAANVEVRGADDSHIHIRTLSGPVTLSEIKNGHIEVTSVGGPVSMNNVDGPLVNVDTTSGKISYTGNFGQAGSYSLINHSGDIEVALPADASVDISARSMRGTVENDFPFKSKPHPSFATTQGKSFAGTANSGSSSVHLQTFSGKIRVKKQ